MTEPTTTPKAPSDSVGERAKKRRTPAEMKAYHEGELKRLAAEEKAEVVRLLSDAHDTVEKAFSLAACTPLKPAVGPIITALKAQIAAAQK